MTDKICNNCKTIAPHPDDELCRECMCESFSSVEGTVTIKEIEAALEDDRIAGIESIDQSEAAEWLRYLLNEVATSQQRVKELEGQRGQAMNDDRYKELMEQVGMPNSQSLLAALKQVANEVAQAQADEIKRLRAALRCLAEGDTPWIDGYHEESWEVMAAYAKATLEAKL